MQDLDDGDWFQLIKLIRAERRVGILEAEEIELRDSKWRRWLERRINSDRKCWKLALSHIKPKADRSLIRWEGERLVVRSPAE